MKRHLQRQNSTLICFNYIYLGTLPFNFQKFWGGGGSSPTPPPLTLPTLLACDSCHRLSGDKLKAKKVYCFSFAVNLSIVGIPTVVGQFVFPTFRVCNNLEFNVETAGLFIHSKRLCYRRFICDRLWSIKKSITFRENFTRHMYSMAQATSGRACKKTGDYFRSHVQEVWKLIPRLSAVRTKWRFVVSNFKREKNSSFSFFEGGLWLSVSGKLT